MQKEQYALSTAQLGQKTQMLMRSKQVLQVSEADGLHCGILCLRGGSSEKWTAQVPLLQLITAALEYRPKFTRHFNMSRKARNCILI